MINTRFLPYWRLVFILALLLVSSGYTQIELDAEKDIETDFQVRPATLISGGDGELVVSIALPEDTHITSLDGGYFFVRPDSTDGVTWRLPVFPSGVELDGDVVYQGKVEVRVPFAVSDEFSSGDTIQVSGNLGYQVCTETAPFYCLPPVEKTFDLVVPVIEAMVSDIDEPVVESEKLTLAERTKRGLESGSWMTLLWIFLGGIALSFTPCVYPVIPITIAYIGARSGGSRFKGFTLSLVFVLGLGLVYSILGVVAAATGGVFGISTQNTWVIGFVTLVFLVMGAGMLGAFEMSLPSSVQTRLSSRKRSGYVGALLVGGTTGLVAAPCVGPVLVALLSWVSASGDLFKGFIYLFVFACGLGVLFVVIGTFAGALASLPTAGSWMENVKKVFGVILIGAALYFGKALIPESWFNLVLGLAWMMLAGLMGGFSRLESDAGLGSRIVRGLTAFIIFIGAWYTLLGITSLSGLDMKSISVKTGADRVTETGTLHSQLDWLDNEIDLAFEQAQRESRPVMIDFWAEWCVACKELEHKTFNDPQISEILSGNFVLLKVDLTRNNPTNKAIYKDFGIIGLPTVIFLTPDKHEITRFEAFMTVEQLLPILDGVISGKQDK